MALKTLKDIEPGIAFSGKEVKELGLKFSDMKKVEFIQGERDKNIKQEAIKWVKEMEDSSFSHVGNHPMMETLGIADDVAEPSGMINWAMHFFNITDEDLK